MGMIDKISFGYWYLSWDDREWLMRLASTNYIRVKMTGNYS